MISIFLFSFISSIYLFSAGTLFYFKKKIENSDIFLSVFLGAFILSFLSLFLNFFISLNINANNFIFIFIILFGLITILKKKNLFRLIKYFFLISLISTLILSFDTIYRPDANLYHLPYTKIINENKIIFGIANIHFRFGHISVLQYLNAIFNNSLFSEKGILIPAAILFSSTILYFYKEIIQNIDKNKIYSYYVFLLLASILLGYNRYSEFGNDTIAHLFLFIISSYFLKNNFSDDNDANYFSKILIFSFFCFILKTGLILIFLIPLFILITNFKKKFIFNYINLFLVIVVMSWFAKNIIVSGCFIYPIEITCFEKLEWFSNSSEYLISAKIQSLDNNAWTKDWSNYKGPVVSQEIYVKKFFWLKTWLSVHGVFVFKKVFTFIFILFLLNFYLSKIDKSKRFEKIKINRKIKFLFFFSLFCTLVWFFRFPLYRYGSSYIITLIISATCILVIKKRIIPDNSKIFIQYLKICLVIFFFLFTTKHFVRIIKNYNNYTINDPWPKFPTTNDTNSVSQPKKINNNFAYNLLKPNQDGCGYTKPPCTPYLVKKVMLKEINGYKFFYLEK